MTLKHPDPNEVTKPEWNDILSNMPLAVRRGFSAARERRKAQCARLLAQYEKGEGGLTTYAPDAESAIYMGAHGLETMGELIERAELEARIRRHGLIRAHQDIAEGN